LTPTIKSKKSPRFPCILVTCNTPLERSLRGLQLFFRPHLNLNFTHKVLGPQSCRSPSCGNFETLETKWHLGAGPMARHKVYYKGEGGGFPQVQVMVSLVNPCLYVARPCTKVLQLHTNQLIVWFVQVHVDDWIACQSS
jgi:hypothetical protein